MPELPEVETVVRGLKRNLVGRKIVRFWTDWPRGVTPEPVKFNKLTRGAKITEVSRRGKYIQIRIAQKGTPRVILGHLRMTGVFGFGNWTVKKGQAWAGKEPVRHLHTVLFLDRGEALGLSDVRKFATLSLDSPENIKDFLAARLGPEPIYKLDSGRLLPSLLSRKAPIKNILLDQSFLAGIGNIYADEILWRARISPLRRGRDLKAEEFKRVLLSAKAVLRKAIALRGTTMRDFRDTAGQAGKYWEARAVYGRTDEACRRCRDKITRVVLGGRSSHFCKTCQI